MERNFNNELERFLKENADQYRLYPSSKVWNGIYTALHTRRKWFGLGIILLLITGTLVTFLITHSTKETVITNTQPVAGKQQAPPSAVAIASPNSSLQIISIEHKNHPENRIAADNINIPGAIFYPINYHLDLANADNHLAPLAENNAYSKVENSFGPLSVNLTDELTDQDIVNNIQSLQKRVEYPKSLRNSNPSEWTIESVLNSFIRLRRNKRISYQFNLTPTVSYRKLSANKPFLATTTNTPSSFAPLYDINSVVTHKPDLGLEFGFTTKYALTPNFKVRAGLQFNINRYDIKAFNSSFEVAKIDLRGASGVDSFYAFSTHRNFNGYKSDWLHNFYFEISLPVGLEVNIVGDDKVQFGVAGTIQPTYVLGERAYLLSTDYKNYAEVPWLIRHWNVNAGFETFVTYSTRKMKWQVGPQVRYQLLSSFVDKYPVKENLFDFGLKVGVSLNK